MTAVDLNSQRAALDAHLRSLGRLLVAYSGGVDSAFLAFAARETLGDGMLAVLADSPSLARRQLQDAVAFAQEQRIPLEVIETAEVARSDYARNDSARCFYCKDELFSALEELRRTRGFDRVAYGVNRDDLSDFRPGQQAAAQHGVAAPLLEAGLTKAEVRALARAAGLRVWDKPASPCLSSRLAYGLAVTPERLAQVEHGEEALAALGFRVFRVRHHGDLARIEIAPEELGRALSPAMAAEFTRIFKALGFAYVTLDLEGFRSGSLNAILPAATLTRSR